MTVAAAPTLARTAARYRRRRLLKTVGLGVAVILVLVYTLFPYYWAIVSSLKTGASLFEATLLPAFDPVYYKALLHDPVFLGCSSWCAGSACTTGSGR
jgi:trehalose/maltose transport system permease protein